MYDISSVISRELDNGERLLWSGQPRQGVFLRGSDMLLIPFSLVWGGFAIFWEYSVVHQGGAGFMALWGIPFVLAGTYIMIGRFFFEAMQRSKTFYGVTDKRVLILSGVFSRQSQSLAARLLPDISLREGSNGYGSVILGQETAMAGFFAGSAWPRSRGVAPRLDSIKDAKRVYDTIREIRDKNI